jgi:hypothetical protein
VARKGCYKCVFLWSFFTTCERGKGHHDARGTEAALQRMLLTHRLLNGMECAIGFRKTLDSHDRLSVGLHCQHQTGAHCTPVDDYRAGAAYAMLTTEMDAGIAAMTAQEIGE